MNARLPDNANAGPRWLRGLVRELVLPPAEIQLLFSDLPVEKGLELCLCTALALHGEHLEHGVDTVQRHLTVGRQHAHYVGPEHLYW